MEINENLAKLIFREFDDSIKGTDIYNHDGSMWLIFTEERKWVFEFFVKIKDYFDKIFLISHNPMINQCSDSIVKISKQNNISKLLVN